MSAFPFPPDEAPQAPEAAIPTFNPLHLMVANQGLMQATKSLAEISRGGVDISRLGARILAQADLIPEGPDRELASAALTRQGRALIAAATFLATLTQLGLAPEAGARP